MKCAPIVFSLVLAMALTARVTAQVPLEPNPDPEIPGGTANSPAVELPRHISLGMTPDEVLVAMQGPPNEKLSSDIWIYWSFEARRVPALRKFDTLVVFFSSSRVCRYTLMERKVVKELLADVRRSPNPSRPELISECARPIGPDGQPAGVPRRVGLGMTPADVVRAMQGQPDEKLTPEIWAYWGFRLEDDAAVPQPTALLVFFADGRVGKYRLTDRQAVAALLSETKA